MNNCRAGKGRAGRDVPPAQQVGLKCQSLLTCHHVGHYSALGQVVGDIRKKYKSRVVGIADVCCETVSLRTSCERVHTNPTVLDAAKKVPHRDAMRQPKPHRDAMRNPTAQALCVAREQQSMTNDYQAVVGSDPVWGGRRPGPSRPRVARAAPTVVGEWELH